MTNEVNNLFRVFLISTDPVQTKNLSFMLGKKRCEVTAYSFASDIPAEIASNPDLAPHAILVPNSKLSEAKKSPIFNDLLILGSALYALTKDLSVDIKDASLLKLDESTEIPYSQVKVEGGLAVIKSLCEKYNIPQSELVTVRNRG